MAPWWALASSCQTVIGDVPLLPETDTSAFGALLVMQKYAVSSFVIITHTVLHLSVPISPAQNCSRKHSRHQLL
jgi:hypothetical protein